MHVLMIVSRFFPCVGGTESQALSLARTLRQLGTQAEVLTQQYDPALPREETVSGIPVHRIPPRGSIPLAAARFVQQGLRFLSRQKRLPEIFHAHMIASTAVLAAIAGGWFKRRTIVKVAC